MREDINKLADVTCEELYDESIYSQDNSMSVWDVLNEIEEVTDVEFQLKVYRDVLSYIGAEKANDAIRYVLNMHGVQIPNFNDIVD